VHHCGAGRAAAAPLCQPGNAFCHERVLGEQLLIMTRKEKVDRGLSSQLVVALHPGDHIGYEYARGIFLKVASEVCAVRDEHNRKRASLRKTACFIIAKIGNKRLETMIRIGNPLLKLEAFCAIIKMETLISMEVSW
jgi:hypothetical protein